MHAAHDDDRLDEVLSALADRTRRRLLAQLTRGPASVGELAEPIAMSLPAVSKHLKVLERADLVRRERIGRVHRIHLSAAPIATAQAFLETYRPFWHDTLDALARHLEGEGDR